MATASPAAEDPLSDADSQENRPMTTVIFATKGDDHPVPRNAQELAEKWLFRFFDLGRAFITDKGFVFYGFPKDQAILDKNLKAGGVKLKGCLFNIGLLTHEQANAWINPPERSDFEMDFSDSEFATTTSDEEAAPKLTQKRKASPKSPKSAARKASKKAYKKRARERKRSSSSSSSDQPATVLGRPHRYELQIADIATDNGALAHARAQPATPTPPTPSPAKQSPTTRAHTLVRAPVQPMGEEEARSQPTTAAQPETEPTTAAQPQPEPVTAAQPRRRNKKQRFLAIDLSKVDIPVPERPLRDTYLLRPVDPAQSLQTVSPVKLGRFLEVIGRILEIRNIRCGGLAIDFEPGSVDESTALAIPAILDIVVTISRPFGTAAATTASGILSGVHPELTEEEILSNIQSTVPVTAVKRLAKPGTTSWVVKLTFAGLTTPTDVRLFARIHKVKPYVDRPMMCGNCSRFGHPARVCRSTARCRTCGEPHETTTCPTPAVALCCNCGGPHPADSPACPNRAFQVKVMEVKKEQGITFREARKTVTTATRSYAAALKQQQPNDELPRQPAPATANTAAAAVTQTVPVQALADLFQSVLSVLMEAAAKQDFSAVVVQVATLFKGFAAPSV